MNALASWMKASAETDETLAAKAGVSRVQISRIRRGLSRPSLRLAERLEPITGLPAWDLIRLETPAGPDASAQDAAA